MTEEKQEPELIEIFEEAFYEAVGKTGTELHPLEMNLNDYIKPTVIEFFVKEELVGLIQSPENADLTGETFPEGAEYWIKEDVYQESLKRCH